MNTSQNSIRRSYLFASLNDSDFRSVINRAERVEYPAGHLIAEAGEKGNECYVILRGAVEVFTTRADGAEVMLATPEAGEFIGEQALLPGGTGRRNASLRSCTAVTLLKISKDDFQPILNQNRPLKDRLFRRGKHQIRRILEKQSSIFRALPINSIPDEWYREEVFADGTIIFHEGEKGDKVYFIISGKVDVYHEVNGSMQFLLQLKPGLTFGERAFLENKPRAATVIAHGILRVFSIDGDRFLWLHQKSPKVQKYMQSIKRIYSLAGRGYVTQFEGEFMGLDCLTSICTISDRETIVSSQVIGEDIFNLSVNGAPSVKLETIRFEDSNHGIVRELILDDRRIVGVTAMGFWEDLGQTYEAVLGKIPLNRKQIKLFREKGQLNHDFSTTVFYDERQIVCHCLQIRYGDISEGYQQKFKEVDRLMDETGAGTVCGCCVFALKNIVGETRWTPVRIAKTVAVAQGIESFTFEAMDRTLFKGAKPGQHLLVQGLIDGKWVERPYTISSASTETNYREITVKRDSEGTFSRWLFDTDHGQARLRVSDPQGDFLVDLALNDAIVFIVGGIGITPALAICRTLRREQFERTLHIDYSVHTRAHIVCQDELETAAENDRISLNIRVTDSDYRIAAADIRKIVEDFAGARFYLCGPESFINAVSDLLCAAAIPSERIHIERFTPATDHRVNPTNQDFYIGITLLTAFILQEAFQIKWSWLETLQDDEYYRIGSGVVLASYVALQMLLPASRWRGDIRLASQRYRLHKLQGAFAPLAYYLHSTQLAGFGYLGIFSVVFFANIIVGLFNPERITNPGAKPIYSGIWLIVHIVLSLMIVVFVPFHAYLVFAYK